jgi:predicted Zn-dependent protease
MLASVRSRTFRVLPVTLLLACAVNPATGRRQLSFIGEGQEIQMGQEADADIVANFGLHPDEELQRYVQELGEQLAALSERPDLPWTFRVLDDPTVNAFALPGGFIYVTRGILTHMSSEAELAGVLGHEIGHVTARHSVNQMSRAQLAQIGLVAGMLIKPELQQYAGLASQSLGLLFLKFGRDDEREADLLGFRYMTRGRYDPRALAGVFRMLDGVTGSGSGRIPEWLSTHPAPENREAWAVQAVAEAGEDYSSHLVRSNDFVERLDGMVFGANPREGYFKESLFVHPDLAFRMDFPAGWATANQRNSVQALSPNQDALLVLTIENVADPGAGRSSFLSQEGVSPLGRSDRSVNGLPAAWAEFEAETQDGRLQGLVTFVSYGGNVYRLLGYAAASGWSRQAGAVEGSISSFARLTDRSVLAVDPRTVDVVRADRSMTLADFVSRYPSSVPDETVRLINHGFEDGRIPARALVKRVVGPRDWP